MKTNKMSEFENVYKKLISEMNEQSIQESVETPIVETEVDEIIEEPEAEAEPAEQKTVKKRPYRFKDLKDRDDLEDMGGYYEKKPTTKKPGAFGKTFINKYGTRVQRTK